MRALFVALGLLFASPALAQTADAVSGALADIFGDAREFERAFVVLQGAVSEGDAETVAGMVAYPITVRPAGQALALETPEAFVKNYGTIINGHIRDIIVDQRYETMFVSEDGLMFGNGEVWLSGVCSDDACEGFDVRIVAVQSEE